MDNIWEEIRQKMDFFERCLREERGSLEGASLLLTQSMVRVSIGLSMVHPQNSQ